jgi:uncharacterized protein YndB with AHSA1/START domain
MQTVTSSGTARLTTPADNQILIEREFAAPRHLVFEAWTTPELVGRWWSADMGETTHTEIDLRVGGTWRYVMVTHDGFEVAFHGEYREIVTNERIVSTEAYEGLPDPEANATPNTATFDDLGDGRTKLTVLVQCPSREVRDAIIESGMEGGLQKALNFLEEVARSLA